MGLNWLRVSPLSGSCERDDEPSCSMKGRDFLTYWTTISLSRKTVILGIRLIFALLILNVIYYVISQVPD
jgi:hypothetical protein